MTTPAIEIQRRLSEAVSLDAMGYSRPQLTLLLLLVAIALTGLSLREWRAGFPDFKRDYVDGAELRDAESVLTQLGRWIEDYNTQAPHSALGMRSPAEYRAEVTLSSSR